MCHLFKFFGLALWLLLAGCGDRGANRGEPFYRRGLSLEAGRNYPGAIQSYLTCVGRQPDHATACYRLAYLNDSQTNNGTELAVHYYRRYLELEPQGKEAKTAQRRLETMQQQLLAKLAVAYPEMMPKAWDKKLASSYVSKDEADRQRRQMERQMDALRADNADLRRRNEALASRPVPEPAEPVKPPPAKEPDPEVAKEPQEEPAPTAVLTGVLRFHIVQPNDNLSTISRKYYGTIRHWRLILERNKELLRGAEKNLRPGMRLEIPPLDEKPAAVPEPVG